MRASPRRAASAAPGVVRVFEAIGSSSRSWDAAVADAVRGAAGEVPDPLGVEVVRLWADLDGRKRLRTYNAAVKIAYRQALSPPEAGSGRARAPRRAPPKTGRKRT